MNLTRKIREYYILILILIFAGILISINLDKPFIGHHDWNGAWYSNFARNFTRYGLLQTKFGSVLNYDFVNPSDFRYFTHYPPLLPILLFVSFKIFGISEWSARIVPLLFSLATISAIYFLGLKFFDKKTAVLAAAISTVFPIMIYFGTMPVQEVLVLPLVLVSVYFYFVFFEKPDRGNFLKLIAVLFISHLTNWPAYYLTPLFFLHFLIFAKSKWKLQLALAFPVFSLLMFGLHMAHLIWLTGKPFGGGMIEVFLYRANFGEKLIGYSTLNFLKTQARMLVVYFTRLAIVLSAVSLLWMIIKMKNHQIERQVQLITILGIFGVTHNLIFRNMAFIHDYMIIYLLPFFAIGASHGFFLIVKNFRISKTIQFILVTIILALVLFERNQFVRTLKTSQNFSEGVRLGLIIKKLTQSGQKALILSPDFKKYYEVFTGYYADRNIDYDLPPLEKMQLTMQEGRYKLIVAIPSRDTPQTHLDVLQQHYQMTKIDQFYVFSKL
ncbi:glycosyltransferase family 39 protein [Candidatus Curtissbacteria bacterium]|nr:glycosyltransferase family 39 protein [Candidatus Curtissbacteria bacterium]